MVQNVIQQQEPLPDYFQERDVQWVFDMIRAGESSSLIGIGSVGKSNLMQFLTTDRVKQRYLQQNQAITTLNILIDPHKLVHLEKLAMEQAGGAWPGYEIMLSRLRRTLAELEDKGIVPPKMPNGGDGIFNRVEEQYANIFREQPLLAQSGIRHLEESVYEVLRLGPDWRITFLFDEIESFLHLPPDFFQSMRGLRDEFKQRVMFVTSSRAPLDELVQKHVEPEGYDMMESFTELFHGFIRYIGPLERASADFMVHRLEKRYTINLGTAGAQTLMNITGCHAGLLRRSFRPFSNVIGMGNSFEQLFDHLLKDRGVMQECETMFNSLSPSEQNYMRQIVSGQQVSTKDDAWKSLSNKHLVTTGVNGQPTLTMPILGGYIFKEMQQRNGRGS
jgi:hypothetical protein